MAAMTGVNILISYLVHAYKEVSREQNWEEVAYVHLTNGNR